jgi:hypothetical protein
MSARAIPSTQGFFSAATLETDDGITRKLGALISEKVGVKATFYARFTRGKMRYE